MRQPSADGVRFILILKLLRLLHAWLGKRLLEMAEGSGFVSGPSTALGTNGFSRGHRSFSAFIFSPSCRASKSR
jgi:hypothetical protein